MELRKMRSGSHCASWLAKALAISLLIVPQVIHGTTCRRCYYLHRKTKVCLMCPSKTYQPDHHYSGSECIPWSTKPENENWVKVRHGTACRDIEWKCAEGYHLPPSSHKCEKNVPSIVSLTSHTKSVENTTLEKKFDNTSLQNVEKSSDIKEILIPTLSVGLFCLIAICLGIFLYWYRKNKTNKDNETTNGPDSVTYYNVPPEMNERSCRDLVKDLGNKARIFVHILHSPAKDFNASHELYDQNNVSNSTVSNFSNSLMNWAQKNQNENLKGLIQEALEFLDMNDKTRRVYDGELSLQDKVRSQCPQAQYRLFYFLTGWLKPDESKTLFYCLWGDLEDMKTRTAESVFSHFESLYRSELIFAEMESLMEWHKHAKGNVKHALCSTLSQDLERRDVCENEKFQELLHYITLNIQDEDHETPDMTAPTLPDVPETEPAEGNDHIDGPVGSFQSNDETEDRCVYSGANNECSGNDSVKQTDSISKRRLNSPVESEPLLTREDITYMDDTIIGDYRWTSE